MAVNCFVTEARRKFGLEIGQTESLRKNWFALANDHHRDAGRVDLAVVAEQGFDLRRALCVQRRARFCQSRHCDCEEK